MGQKTTSTEPTWLHPINVCTRNVRIDFEKVKALPSDDYGIYVEARHLHSRLVSHAFTYDLKDRCMDSDSYGKRGTMLMIR